MRIVNAETSIVEIPFPPAGNGSGVMPTVWDSLEFALVKLEDDAGNVGWGEGWGYSSVAATKSIMDTLILPGIVGSEIDDITSWNEQMQITLHLQGRYGITMFALSGVDIALWDLASKRAGLPLSEFVGTQSANKNLKCYASLMRYDDEELLKNAVSDALDRGYDSLKLHETQIPLIRAAREVAGPGVAISVDVNCRWTTDFMHEHQGELRDLDLAWLEEPIFPPEDFATLASLRQLGIPLAAGENLSTSVQFGQAVDAVDYWQPSVTKVGGISEYLKILSLADRYSKPTVPHCPYFGPGFFATIQLAAAFENMDNIEILFADPESWLSPIRGAVQGNEVISAEVPGTGFRPDTGVLRQYRRS